MGQQILGGALVGLSRGFEGFRDAQRDQRQERREDAKLDLDKRFSNLQFKELGLRIEQAEFQRDKRIATGSPEEQAAAERDFEEATRLITQEAQNLDNELARARIEGEKADTALAKERTKQLGLDSLFAKPEDDTQAVLDSLFVQKKILEGQIEQIRDGGGDEADLKPIFDNLNEVDRQIVAIQGAIQEGLIGGGQFPPAVGGLLDTLNNPPPANIQPAASPLSPTRPAGPPTLSGNIGRFGGTALGTVKPTLQSSFRDVSSLNRILGQPSASPDSALGLLKSLFTEPGVAKELGNQFLDTPLIPGFDSSPRQMIFREPGPGLSVLLDKFRQADSGVDKFIFGRDR